MTFRIRWAALFLTAIAVSVSISAEAAKFKGFPEKPKSSAANEKVLIETVQRFEQTDKEFLILFSKHAAFYRMPKTKELSPILEPYLRAKIKERGLVRASLNPLTNEITELEDFKNKPSH